MSQVLNKYVISGVCNFNGKHGCLKCTTVGDYSHSTHTVVFSTRKYPPRNDEDFRRKIYGGHHKADSPLLKLPIDMIQHFPVADSLHLIDLGIIKRLLQGWRDGNFGKYLTKWRARDIDTLNLFLSKCKLPSEIHRAVRTLDCLAFWKASEFRTFLLYLSIIILPHVLRDDAFEHFLALFCAVTICSAECYRHLLRLANEMIKHYVEHYKNFYGSEYITSNVHNLLHVVEEVKRFGTFQTFNAYPFENKLFVIKKMLRQGNKPLAQVANRICEYNSNATSLRHITLKFDKPFTTERRNMTVLHFIDFALSPKQVDKYCLSHDEKVIEIQHISSDKQEIKIYGRIIKNITNIFEKPIRSSLLNSYKAEEENMITEDIVLAPRDIMCKLVCISHQGISYFIPLLHTI